MTRSLPMLKRAAPRFSRDGPMDPADHENMEATRAGAGHEEIQSCGFF